MHEAEERPSAPVGIGGIVAQIGLIRQTFSSRQHGWGALHVCRWPEMEESGRGRRGGLTGRQRFLFGVPPSGGFVLSRVNAELRTAAPPADRAPCGRTRNRTQETDSGFLSHTRGEAAGKLHVTRGPIVRITYKRAVHPASPVSRVRESRTPATGRSTPDAALCPPSSLNSKAIARCGMVVSVRTDCGSRPGGRA
jgi:hypothetical protein